MFYLLHGARCVLHRQLGSIAENAATMGEPVSEWLTKMLVAGRKAADMGSETLTVVNGGKNADGTKRSELIEKISKADVKVQRE